MSCQRFGISGVSCESCDAKQRPRLKLCYGTRTYCEDAKEGPNDDARQNVAPVMHVVWHSGESRGPCSHDSQKLQEVLQQLGAFPCHADLQVHLQHQIRKKYEVVQNGENYITVTFIWAFKHSQQIKTQHWNGPPNQLAGWWSISQNITLHGLGS